MAALRSWGSVRHPSLGLARTRQQEAPALPGLSGLARVDNHTIVFRCPALSARSLHIRLCPNPALAA